MAKKRKKRSTRRYSCARRATRPNGTKYCAKFKGRSPNKGRTCLAGELVPNKRGGFTMICRRFSGPHKTERKRMAAAKKRARRGGQSLVMQQAAKLFKNLPRPANAPIGTPENYGWPMAPR